ncbi:MAG: hypothetical protein RMM06_01445 [Armatimonadota bacterium]|nr:hypothetical protein [bacterium]MCS7309995.1 hypothetical protein [Armatimonadota bacterium]MDW8103567.1 hypothetical protein [Armatimonadota bacterium]MDW8289360.1 hypothetical protein [Armatimonadota bacterium]
MYRDSAFHLGRALLLALFVLTSGTRADRVVLSPSGYNLPPGSLKLEVARRERNGELTQYWLNLGIVGGIELEVVRQERAASRVDSVGIQYNLLPDIGFTPAVSIGIRDVSDRTNEGFAVYTALGHRLPYMPPNPFIEEMYLFGGVGAGGIRGPFVGTEIRTPYRLWLSAEYDSRAWNFALSWEPVPLLRLRLYSLDGKTFYGASLAVSF